MAKINHDQVTPPPTSMRRFSNKREMRVATRLVLLFMSVVLLAVGSTAGVIIYTRNTMDKIIELSRKTYDKTDASLAQYHSSTEVFIQLKMKEKAELIAEQVEILFRYHPETLIASDLKAKKYEILRKIIETQRVGEDGFVCVIDPINREIIFHRDYERGQKLALIDEFENLNKLLTNGTYLIQVKEFSKGDMPGLANIKISEANVFNIEDPVSGREYKEFWSITHIADSPFAFVGTGSLEGVSSMALSQQASSTLSEIGNILRTIEEQVKRTMQGSLYMITILGFIAILLFWFLYFMVNRSIIVPIQNLVHSAEIISRGNYEVRAEFIGGGEFRELAIAINNMLDRIVGLIESDEDRRKLQANIMRLLEIVDRTSKGDFTTRGIVTDDVLGSVTDAFNLMLESIGQLILRIRKAAHNVTMSAEELQEFTENITRGAAEQAKDIGVVSKILGDANEKFYTMAENAGQAAIDSERTTQTADHGNELVSMSVREMYSIRQHVQSTAKQLKNLGDKSIEINSIVELIEDIASQTNNLALNSAIEASRAGAAGKGFAVVADEIRKLAVRITRATKDISTFIEGIQDDANSTIKAMEDVTSEVEEGVKLSDAVGNSLTEISSVAHTASIRTKDIYEGARKQVEVMEDVMNIIENVFNVTRRTEDDTSKMKNMMGLLMDLSSDLTEAISEFTVREFKSEHEQAKNALKEKAEQLKGTVEMLQSIDASTIASGEMMATLDHALGELNNTLSAISSSGPGLVEGVEEGGKAAGETLALPPPESAVASPESDDKPENGGFDKDGEREDIDEDDGTAGKDEEKEETI